VRARIVPEEEPGCAEDYSTHLGGSRSGAAVRRPAEPAGEPRGCDGGGGEIGIGRRGDWGFRASLVRLIYLGPVFRTICSRRVDETGHGRVNKFGELYGNSPKFDGFFSTEF
jgi:hypothetical protein